MITWISQISTNPSNRASSLRKVAIAFLLTAIVALADCGKRTQTFDGREVYQVRTRWALVLGLPFPGRIQQEYYAYADERGNEVRHGPYKSFYGDGRPNIEGLFREGKPDGTWTQFHSNGLKDQETFYRMGKEIGRSLYVKGQIDYSIEGIYEDGKEVGEKKYEHGRWTLTFSCGAAVDKRIDESTGIVSDLAPPFAVACRQ